MTRYSKDPDLNEMAKELKSLVWLNPLTEEEQETVRHLTTDPEARRRLVIPMPDFRHYSVRIYLGGDTRTIGLVHANNVGAAFRFADMAQEYFWKYRVRGANPPAERDLNFDYDRLHADMDHEPNALDLLKRIEEYLLRTGAIKSSATRLLEIQNKRAQRLNLRSEIKLGNAEILEFLGGLHETCASIKQQLADNRAGIEDMRARTQILVDEVKRLSTPVVNLPGCQPATPYIPGTIWTGSPPPQNPITICCAEQPNLGTTNQKNSGAVPPTES